MKKCIKRLVVAVMAFAMIFSATSIPSKAATLEGRTAVAYLGYADSAWTYQYWGGEAENNVITTNADITGDGQYTVGLDFTKTEAKKAEGLAFSAVMIDAGNALFPNACITVDEVKVNGTAVEVGKGYTTSDNGKELRSNLYNEWVTEIDTANSWRADGDVADISAIVVDKEKFASVETVEVTFTVSGCDTTAYLGYADSAWTYQYWGGEPENNIIATTADVKGDGQYTVGLDFTKTEAKKAEGIAFSAVMVNNLERLAPGAFLTIDEIKVNGEAIEVGKAYTSSDEGIVTRANLYNEWVTEIPVDARRADNDLADISAIVVNKDLFASVETFEVTFTVKGATPTAYLGYADSAWTYQYWGGATDNNIVATNAVITGEGSYSVGLDFTKTEAKKAEGLAFSAVMIDAGEKLFPGWFITVDSVQVNGQDIEVGKGYTSSDEGVVTRSNLYNEWVTEIPEGTARRADGDLADISAIVVDKETFASVETVVVNFTVTWGAKPVEVEEEPIVVEYSGTYHAYLGVQTNTNLWIFRNAFDDATYGLGSTEFEGLWSTSTNQKYDGTFTDTEITGDGTYTVKLEGGDFQEETALSQLFVSTDLPYSDAVTFSDVSVKIDGSEKYSVAEGLINKESKTYLQLTILNVWNEAAKEPFGYTMPVKDIEVTFTVSGLGYAAEATAAEPTPTPSAEPAATVEPVAVETTGIPVWVWIVVGVVVVGAVVAVVVVTSKKKKSTDNKEEKK